MNLLDIYSYNYVHVYYSCKPIVSGVETASHAGHCPINLVNVRYNETELYTKYTGSRTRVAKIGQNVRQLAQCFHTPAYSTLIIRDEANDYYCFLFSSLEGISCKTTISIQTHH